MKRQEIALTVFVAVLAVTGVTAHAAVEFDVNFSGPNDNGFGMVTAEPDGNGTYSVLGGTFTVGPSTAQNHFGGTYTVSGGSFTENGNGSQPSATCDLVLVFSARPGGPTPVLPSAAGELNVQSDIRISSGATFPNHLGVLSADPEYSTASGAGSGSNPGTGIELLAQNGVAWLSALGASLNERENGVVTIDMVAVPEPASIARYACLLALGLLGLATLRDRFSRAG